MVWIAKSRLVTAHIIYQMPDHRWLLQDYVWQDYDYVPGFPALHLFLNFWRTKLDGPIHSVHVGSAKISPDDFLNFADFAERLQ